MLPKWLLPRVTLVFLVLGVFEWAALLLLPRGSLSVGIKVIFVCVGTASTFILVMGTIFAESRVSEASWPLITLLAVVWVFVATFAIYYYVDGSYVAGSGKAGDYTCGSHYCQLSRWGAIYFTIGTLSTAGTGNIAAVGRARPIQGIQMILGMVLVLFALTAVVARFVSGPPIRDKSQDDTYAVDPRAWLIVWMLIAASRQGADGTGTSPAPVATPPPGAPGTGTSPAGPPQKPVGPPAPPG